MQEFVDSVNAWVWSPALVSLALGVGLLFSILTRFVQVRLFREMVSLLFASKSSERGISSFQALAVSLSGRVGTGNIAGVAAAIGFGGPGAVVWMWIVAFLGASTAYIESTLGQIYKEEDEGQFRGGPAYYIEKAMGQKWYAWVFAITTIVATGILLPGVQANAITSSAEVALGSGAIVETAMGPIGQTKIVTAVAIVIVFGLIIFGGVKRIAAFTQVVVPFMALTYIITACAIIVLNITELPGVIGLMLKDAVSPMAPVGAMIGWGVKRGVYSNEAGQGTGPHAAAASEVQHPAQQGLVQAFSVYIDTLFVCSATAFMILITGAYNVQSEATGAFLVQNLPATARPDTPAFTQYALEAIVPGVGAPFVAVALFFFAFTTVLAYYYIAETNIAYLHRTIRVPGMILMLKFVMMGSVFYGAVRTASVAWGLGDIGVGLMAWLNIVGILIIFLMGKPALKALKDYEEQKKAGVDTYRFDAESLGIKNAHFWVQRTNDER